MYAKGAIRNREYANTVRDFTGLRWGNITPTDIDGFVDFGGKAFVFTEIKYKGQFLPRGQRLALERLCDTCTQGGADTIVFVVEHEGGGDIDVASCTVTEFRWHGKWHTPKRELTTRQAVDDWRVFIERSNTQEAA